jgi:hypothetical protein
MKKAVLLTPFALLMPAAALPALPQLALPADPVVQPVQLVPQPEAEPDPGFDMGQIAAFRTIADSFRAQAQQQVRIEQRITIRITPHPAPVQQNILSQLPSRASAPVRIAERNMGKCVPATGIAGVQISGDNRLIFYMRDQRIVRASLERACSARDYYSGFYVQRTSDGQICVNRDTLQSRSGASCKLSKIKQLVEEGN